MGKENILVPIDEAHTDRIRFVSEFPYVDKKQIGVNLNRIQQIMDLGGIRSLRVSTVEKKEESHSPTVVGFDSQGGAYAGKTSSRTIGETHEYEGKVHRDKESGFSPVVDLTINLNTVEMSGRISRKEGVRSADAWSREIDRIVKKGMRDSGTRVLTIETWKREWGAHVGYFSVYVPHYIKDGNFRLADILVFLLVGMTASTAHQLMVREHRLSLFYGPQLDRAALLQLRTRTQKIVAAIDAEK